MEPQMLNMRYLVTQVLLFVGLMASSAFADSATIRENIFEAIEKDPNFGRYEIEVDARRGIVTLSGTVSSTRARDFVAQVAANQRGVEAVHNELEVEGPPVVKQVERIEIKVVPPDDETITRRVLQALRANPEVDLTEIEVTTHNGVVAFQGERSNHRDIDRMLSVALMVPGVRDIESNIRGGSYHE